jgi:hypothetical protein
MTDLQLFYILVVIILMMALGFVLLLGRVGMGFTKLHDSIYDAITLRDTKDGIPRDEMVLMNVKACKEQLMKDIQNQIRLGCTGCYISVNVFDPSIKPIYVVELVPRIDYYHRWLVDLGYTVTEGHSGQFVSLNIRW